MIDRLPSTLTMILCATTNRYGHSTNEGETNADRIQIESLFSVFVTTQPFSSTAGAKLGHVSESCFQQLGVEVMTNKEFRLPPSVGRLLCWLGLHDFRVISETFGFGSGGVEKVECRRCGLTITRPTRND